KRLRESGTEVEIGLRQKEAVALNKRFFTAFEKKRPYIILKWAQTADGFIARENYDSKWVSDEHSRALVHLWRSQEDAILVGKNTARYDNPKLNVRDLAGNNPLRVVIDHYLELDSGLHLFSDGIATLCYNTTESRYENNVEYVKIESIHFIDELLIDLASRGIQSLIVEGGAQTLNIFIAQSLWDEARVFESASIFKKGIPAPQILKKSHHMETLISDKLFLYRNK
ncbi:MAG: RibD family protein, partial [Bacteroidota bacterium]